MNDDDYDDVVVQSIVSLGYTIEQAQHALSKNDNNIDDAIDWLFTKGRVVKTKKNLQKTSTNSSVIATSPNNAIADDYDVDDHHDGQYDGDGTVMNNGAAAAPPSSLSDSDSSSVEEHADDFPSPTTSFTSTSLSSSLNRKSTTTARKSRHRSGRSRRGSVVRFADSESAPSVVDAWDDYSYADYDDDDDNDNDDGCGCDGGGDGGGGDLPDLPLDASFRRRSLHNVPLVELALNDIVYAPITSTIVSNNNATNNNSSSSRQRRHSIRRHKRTIERKVVLNDVSTRVAPFQLSAWMGPSGSGKTSLITVAAGLYSPGDVQMGTINVNDEEGSIPKRLVGVVWQDDLLLGNLTVEETIYFSAKLKTPSTTPDLQVRQVVNESMDELGLLHIRDSLIGSTTSDGSTTRGISGGERKRVSVASELVARPSVLFLDEPTSGLDSTSAQLLMQTLKHLAVKGHAIAVVIHQPRTAIFNMLDNLLLLSQGKVVYNGKACNARAYLESCDSVQKLPPETGIADWIMDVIKDDEKNGAVLPEHWNQNKDSVPAECSEHLTPAAKASRRLFRKKSSLAELRAIPKFETTFWVQLRLLTSRVLKQQRGEKVTRVNLLLTLTYIIFTGFFWWRLPNDTSSIYNRNSLLFFMLIAQSNGIVIASVNTFQRESALLSRERAKKMFGVLPFFIAKTASDMTNNVLLPVVYGMVSYWMGGLRPTAAAFFKFSLSFYVTLSAAQSMGLFLSVAIPSMTIALILAPPITLFFILMGGFYIPFDSMNVFIWWLSWLSFARYGYSSFLINEYEGRMIPCAEEDSTFLIGGDECPVSGDDVIADFGIRGDPAANFWFNVIVVVAMQIAFRVASYVLLRRSK